MLIDIKAHNQKIYDCYQSVIVTLAKHYGYDYHMLSCGTWQFPYKIDGKLSIGERMSFSYSLPISRIRHFHGLDIKMKKYHQASDINVIQQIIANYQPVIIKTDAFWCPWNIAYQSFHTTHYFIINGYDEIDRKLICLDPFTSDRKIEVSYDLISPGIEYYGMLNILPAPELKLKTYYNELIIDLVNFTSKTKNSHIDNINAFADDIEYNLNYSRELEGHDYFSAPIFDNLRVLYTYRAGYGELIRYIGLKFEIRELILLSGEFKTLSKKWENIRFKLIKKAMKNSITYGDSSIADDIRNLSDCEFKLANQLSSIIKI